MNYTLAKPFTDYKRIVNGLFFGVFVKTAGDQCTGKVSTAVPLGFILAPLKHQKCQYFIRRMHISRLNPLLER